MRGGLCERDLVTGQVDLTRFGENVFFPRKTRVLLGGPQRRRQLRLRLHCTISNILDLREQVQRQLLRGLLLGLVRVAGVGVGRGLGSSLLRQVLRDLADRQLRVDRDALELLLNTSRWASRRRSCSYIDIAGCVM